MAGGGQNFAARHSSFYLRFVKQSNFRNLGHQVIVFYFEAGWSTIGPPA
jgi:hypothetical protein